MPRTRLLSRLVSGAEAPVFVVHAGAGYGKSTLLAQFAAAERRSVAWLSLTEGDDDPAVLLHDLAYALSETEEADGELLSRLQTGPAGVVPLALPRLITLLHERTAPLVIVLDDVHVLRSAGALDVLQALCVDAAPGCALVLSGRRRPGFPLARLRAAGRLSEINAEDLRMTPGEGAAALRAAGVDVDEREAEFIARQTEGWPAAIYLAGLMLRAGGRKGEGIAPGSLEADVAEYVRDEVLADTPPDDVDFLIRSSILDELRPEICDAVLEREDSHLRLRTLVERDLFVSPSDADGGAYRVHGLFREVLQAELRTTGEGVEQDLHRRASASYWMEGDGERAVHHAVLAGEPQTAADLIWLQAPEHVTRGRGATIQRWCGLLSADEVAEHPQAALADGWAALEEGDAEHAAHCAALALGGDPARVLPDGTTLGAMGLLLRGTVGLQGRAQSAKDFAAADPGIPLDSPLRTVALYLRGCLAMLDDEQDRAHELLEDAEYRAAGTVPTAYGLVLAQQALLAIESDSWDQAEALMSRAAAQQRAAGVQGHATQGIVPATRSLVLARRGEVEPARREADQAARNLTLLRFIVPWLALETRLVLAWAYATLGDGRRARTLIQEAGEPLESEPGPMLTRLLARVEGELARLDGVPSDGPDLTTAERRLLQYLPTHLSLREIGERLYITRNTAKTHTLSLYRKLEVNSRSEAVTRSRELGFLD